MKLQKTEFQNEFRKTSPLNFVKPTQDKKRANTELNCCKTYLKVNSQNSDFEIGGLAISEKNNNVKTLETS